MSDSVISALIAAAASVTGSILAFVVARRSLRRSISSSDGVPIGRFVETRIGGLERRLEAIDRSLSEVREALTYERGRTANPLSAPDSRPRKSQA